MKKNVLIVGHSYSRPFDEVNNQYVRLFDKTKYHVTLAYLTGAPNDAIKQQSLADELIFFDFNKKVMRGSKLKAVKAFIELCREKHFTTIICHRYKAMYIVALATLFCKVPRLFCVMHLLGGFDNISRKLFIYMFARKKFIFSGVSTAVTQNLRASLRGLHDEQFVPLHNTLDIATLEPQLFERRIAREKLGLHQDDFLFENIGTLSWRKDQKTLIAAFAQIAERCPRAKLVILGHGDLEQELKQQADDLGLADRIIFTGFVNDVFRYGKAFDAIVSTSLTEGLPFGLLEAMLARLPIIATAVSGVPEIVEGCGALVQAKDTQAIAKAMHQHYQMTDEQRQHIGQQSYQHLCDQFSTEHFRKVFWQLPINQNKH